MHTTRKLLCLLLSALLCLSLGTLALAEEEPMAEAPAADGGGPVGDSLNWSILDGVLSIGGVGPMYDFSTEDLEKSPFSNFPDEIQIAKIDEGVTTVGDYVFLDCTSLTEAYIPVSVTRIGTGVFEGCTSLETIYFAGDGSQLDSALGENMDEFDALIQSGVTVLVECDPGPDPGPDPAPDDVYGVDITENLRDEVNTTATRFSFEEGHDMGRVTSSYRYAGGKPYAVACYFTLATGPNGGEYRLTFTFSREDDEVYVFDVLPNAVYFLTYTYAFSLGTGSSSRTVTAEGPGGSRQLTVSSPNGALKPGDLEVVLVYCDDTVTEPTPEPTPAPTPKPTPEPTPAPTPEPAEAPSLTLSEDGTEAQVTGDYDGLFARVALVLDNGGVSGLYVTQAMINTDGTILVPAFMVPGLTVTGVNVALVPTLADIQRTTPTVLASDFMRF